MSTALGLASVTAVLRDLLNNGLIDHDVTGSLGGNVNVTALPPDRIDASSATSQLNLFLYQVTPNAGWRNEGLPTRDSNGNRVSNPPLALDLHYLMTAYGADELHSEILLGYGMQLFHETPILTRDAIRRSLAPPSNVPAPGALPPALQALFASELAEQPEMIKVVPQALSTEEVSRLWAAFGTKYRPTAAYMASVVLIQSRQSTRAALPVRQRNIYVIPFRHPYIEDLRSEENAANTVAPGQPVLSGHHLLIRGRELRGDVTKVNLGGFELLPDSVDVQPSQIRVQIPAALKAGVQGVQVIHDIDMGTPPEPHSGVSSNLAAFVLRPAIVPPVQVLNLQDLGSGLRAANLDVTVSPAVGDNQSVVLFLNESVAVASPPPLPPVAYSFVAPPRSSSPPDEAITLRIPISGVRTGSYLVRVQVDGAESPLVADAGGQFIGPQVTLL